jgi:hypothetical protein
MTLERWKPRHDGHCAAQICVNGHVITDLALRADDLQPFCAQCGKETFVKCAECGETIRGSMPAEEGSEPRAREYVRPSYCPACGDAYPWTRAQLDAARDLAAELEGLTARDREILAESLDELMADTPRASLAATRFATLVAKARGPGVQPLRQLASDFASASARPHLQPESRSATPIRIGRPA